MRGATYEILETPIGKFTVRDLSGHHPDAGPFDDLPSAVHGMKRLIKPSKTYYDAKGTLLTEEGK